MAFKNEKLEEVANELEKLGLLDRRERIQLESMERRGVAVTVDTVLDGVNPNEIRGSQWSAFKGAAENLGITKQYEARDEEFTGEQRYSMMAANQGRMAQLPGLVDDFKAGFGWLFGSLKPDNTPTEMPEGGDVPPRVLSEIFHTMRDNGLDPKLFEMRKYPTVEGLRKYMLDDMDLPPSVADDIFYQVKVKQDEKIVEASQVEDAAQEEAEQNQINLENPEWSKNYSAFAKLERLEPGKYHFDFQSGAIWKLGDDGFTPQLVDRTGVPFTEEEEMRTELGITDGVLPLERITQMVAEDPTEYQTPWVKAGMDEDQYMSIVDVINNKAAYGADPVRYLPGQEQFLGGFQSNYAVSIDDSIRQQRMRDYAAGEAERNQTAIDPSWYQQLQKNAMQEIRRPWYDPSDNWALFAGLSPESIAQVQRQLVDWGGLEEEEVVWGNWGPTEAQVMQSVMTVANGKAIKWTDDEMMELMPTVFQEQKAASTPRAAFVPDPYRPMDPATVELSIKETVRQMIGRDPTAEDLAELGSYLTDMHASSYAADVQAARGVYDAQVAADEAEASYGEAPAVQDVDWESRFMLQMEDRFAPQIATQERGEQAAKQQDMGVAMSNLMNRLGGGIG